MKNISVPYLPELENIQEIASLEQKLQTNGAFGLIDSVNWPLVSNYKPHSEFYIAHSSKNIYILFINQGLGVKAVNKDNQSPVSQDSCVEFFVQPDISSNRYWNFEFNSIGAVNASHRVFRPQPTRLDDDEISAIKRYASKGTEPFDEIDGIQDWSLLVVIPLSLIQVKFNNKPVKMKANFLKCGSKTKNPHYLSWSPIKTETPDFHQIQYFGELTLNT